MGITIKKCPKCEFELTPDDIFQDDCSKCNLFFPVVFQESKTKILKETDNTTATTNKLPESTYCTK